MNASIEKIKSTQERGIITVQEAMNACFRITESNFESADKKADALNLMIELVDLERKTVLDSAVSAAQLSLSIVSNARFNKETRMRSLESLQMRLNELEELIEKGV